jgi:ADP-heptose:LPS heptosyltransferase
MRKVILHCGFAPGDIVMLTAAVRDLHHFYPGQFVTDVRTLCPEIWENNPHITPLDESGPGVEHVDCSYPLINKANQTPYHCLHGFIEFFNSKFGLAIRPTAFKGAVYLSAQEKAWNSQVREVTHQDIPFWIIAAGGKYDITIKWWQLERYQEVVNALRGKVQFVQVGGAGHHHPRLEGVIDFRGQTNLRELIRLVYHSQGVLCSITALMHLAAAVESRSGCPPTRACVVIAGGREPAHWEQYPGHQFMHTIGALPCCLSGGCWKDRVFPLRDGDTRDRPQNLCTNRVHNLPRCLDLITPEDVVKRIRLHFEGGTLQYLSQHEKHVAKRGIAGTINNAYENEPLNLHNAGMACDRAAEASPADSPTWQGRGIVICGGGIRYFTNAWVCIHMLRRFGCVLPIEVWHLGKSEMSNEMAKLLGSLNVGVVDAFKVRMEHPVRRLKGWELKPYAIIHSRFRETLLLDADNVPVKSPEFLFDTEEFKQTGAVFWPDFTNTAENDQLGIWRSCGLRRPHEPEFETGQVLVDKARCWKALNLCLWFNEHSDFYYRHIHGDKETFHLAFRKTSKSYHLIGYPIDKLEATMCQHDPAGRRLFQHRNMAKWDLVKNRRIKGFWFEDECLAYVEELKSRWDGGTGACGRRPIHSGLSVRKAPRIAAVVAVAADEIGARRTIDNLSRTDWNGAPVYMAAPSDRASRTGWIELFKRAMKSSVDFLLVLQGELLFNSHLHHNLSSWRPLRSQEVALASVYNPQLKEAACDFKNNARVVTARQKFGNEALLVSVESAKFIVNRARRIGTIAELDFSKIAAALKRPIFFHAPSLAQRRRTEATADEKFRPAFDFDPNWRA